MPVGRNGVVPSALNLPGPAGVSMPSPAKRSPFPRSPGGRQPKSPFVEEQMYAAHPGTPSGTHPVSAAAKFGGGRGAKLANIRKKGRAPAAGLPAGGFPGVPQQYAQQHQQPYVDDGDESEENYDDGYPSQQQTPAGGSMMSQQRMQPQMAMAPPRPPPAVHAMSPGHNQQMPSSTMTMSEKMDEDSEEEESDEEGDDEEEDSMSYQQQQHYQRNSELAMNPTGQAQMNMAPMGPMITRPHCSPMCWWKGNRSWERIKAMNVHMRAMFAWIQVASLMHGLLSLLFTFAYNDLQYKSATDAVPEKVVAGGLTVGMIVPGFIGMVYGVISIYCLSAVSLFRPVFAASFLCCLAMLIFSLAGPPKLLLGSTKGDPNLDTGLLHVCAVWSFIVTAMNLLTIPITWYCQRSWIRFLDTYGLPEPFIRRHFCKGFRSLQAAYEDGGYQGAMGMQPA